jgi:cytidine deaminase
VGAALLTRDSKTFTGCNIESPVYLGICAERVALFKALSEGARKFVALAIACEGPTPLLPCGTCRQLLWEFAPKLQIVVEEKGRVKAYRLQDLLPVPFERNGRGPFRAQ